MSKTVTPREVLDTPMQHNDADVATVGRYLAALLLRVWREGEGFSGKRPFGNSGWEHDVYNALAVAGIIEPEDYTAGDRLIEAAIVSLGVTPDGGRTP